MRFTIRSRKYVQMRTLLHVGVPKTGTTAIQSALADLVTGSRGSECGIVMPGTPAEQARAALSVLGQSLGWRKGEAVASTAHWPDLVAQARAAAGSGTVVVSSEFLCEAEPAVIKRIADDLGRDGLRVVITLRPLGRILPSAWQQYLKSGHQLPYEKWLQAVLADPPKRSVTPSFWRRHDHAAVVRRWAAEVGTDQVTVVSLDDTDHGLLLRAFDDLLGLPAGTLTDTPAERRNRSMTPAEAELFRRVNVVLRSTDVSWPEYAHLIRYGAILRSVQRYTPPAGGPRLATPSWALDRAAELGARYAAAITELRPDGLQVVGDLDRLAEPVKPDPDGLDAPPATVPMEVAVEALLGAVSRATNGSLFFPEEPDEPGAGLPGSDQASMHRLLANRLTSRQLIGLITDRVRKRLGRELAGLASRAGRGGVR
jgi:hypothetical protein